ncbi:hypothetical protein LCGC14_2324630, partial [marine sediment metagenome]
EHERSSGFPPGHPPMKGFLGVPILIRGDAYGNLYLAEKEGGNFDAADEEAAVVLAGWAAIAIENARLYKDVETRKNELEGAVGDLEATTAIASRWVRVRPEGACISSAYRRMEARMARGRRL